MEQWTIEDLIEVKNEWKKLAKEQSEILAKIRDVVNDENITKSETVNKITEILGE